MAGRFPTLTTRNIVDCLFVQINTIIKVDFYINKIYMYPTWMISLFPRFVTALIHYPYRRSTLLRFLASVGFHRRVSVKGNAC